jgi:hypothetical protein
MPQLRPLGAAREPRTVAPARGVVQEVPPHVDSSPIANRYRRFTFRRSGKAYGD